MLKNHKATVIAYESGNMWWSLKLVTTSKCNMDFRKFPYDKVKCVLLFSSWNHDNGTIFLLSKPFLNPYKINYIWNITKINATLVYYNFEAYKYEHPFSYSEVTLHLSRNHESLTIGLVIPSTLLSALVLLSFMLPVDCGERISLCMTILLTVMLFQQLTSEMVPRSQLPYLSQYFFILLIILVLTLVANVFIINLHFSGEQRPIPWIIKKLLLRNTACKPNSNKTNDTSNNHGEMFQNSNTAAASNGVSPILNKDHRKMSNQEFPPPNYSGAALGDQRDASKDGDEGLEWILVCNKLDHIFLIFFTIAFMAAIIWVSTV